MYAPPAERARLLLFVGVAEAGRTSRRPWRNGRRNGRAAGTSDGETRITGDSLGAGGAAVRRRLETRRSAPWASMRRGVADRCAAVSAVGCACIAVVGVLCCVEGEGNVSYVLVFLCARFPI